MEERPGEPSDKGRLRGRSISGPGRGPISSSTGITRGNPTFFALDKNTGEEVWKVKRDERTSWVTPTVVEVDGQQQVIMPGTNATRSYDAATGDLIWEADGPDRQCDPHTRGGK